MLVVTCKDIFYLPVPNLERIISSLTRIVKFRADSYLHQLGTKLHIATCFRLLIPNLLVGQKLEMIAKYRIDTKHKALNLARIKFMPLTREEAERCKTEILGICTSANPIYMKGNHRVCVLELFKGDKDEIKNHCQEEALTNTWLPKPSMKLMESG